MNKVALLIAALGLVLPGATSAQSSVEADPGSSFRTRGELEELLELYDRVLESPAYSSSVKAATRDRAVRVRERLEFGDFALGDRIVLFVRNQPDLPDTVAVVGGPRISLPVFGDISLRGVLRSEVEGHLTRELGEYIRDPDVTARALMRMSVQGAVRIPGFYVVPADMLLSEAIMVAGGPAQNSNLDGIRVERGPEAILQGDEAREALRRGLTLDQLNLQAGDQVVVPQDAGGFWGRLGLITGLASTITLVLFRAF